MAKLLVVDDEIAICDFLSNYFTEKGYVVFLATNGEEAIRQARERHPDVVLLDIKMPGISGLEVLRRLKAESNSAKIVIVTAVEDSDVFEQAKRLGAADYITKPFELEYLNSVVIRKIATMLG